MAHLVAAVLHRALRATRVHVQAVAAADAVDVAADHAVGDVEDDLAPLAGTAQIGATRSKIWPGRLI